MRVTDIRKVIALLVLAIALSSCVARPKALLQPVKVEIVSVDGGYQVLRGGQPYVIKGAGLEFADIETLVAHGGNSIRTWTTRNDVETAAEVLDRALAHGVTVVLCLPMGAEHWGFDYDDDEAVARQFAILREEVLKYRNHPALLMWIAGNELNFDYRNPKVWDAVNDIAKMIHELDPNHPVTTTIAGVSGREDVLSDIAKRAPEVDFVSFQVYGELAILPEAIRATYGDEPFMVTEWGATGHWEVPRTEWGAPLEMNSSEKAQVYLRGYLDKLQPLADKLIGSYVFLWGQKQERTATWFGLFTPDGQETEAIDVMHYIWNGSWPDNRAPKVTSLQLDDKQASENVTLYAGETYEAVFAVTDPDGDSLDYRWEVKPESATQNSGGAREQEIANLAGVISAGSGNMVQVSAPAPGEYRLFAYASDGNGNAAHANVPFRVVSRSSGLLDGQVMAIAYSGFREGQYPDRGEGAVNPTDEQILEDLQILTSNGFELIRVYDSGENSARTLELIRAHGLPIKVLLGIWLRAEISNHLGCPWLDEPIPNDELAANRLLNEAEVVRGIALAREHEDVVVAISVGNEALVDWNDHMVPVERVIHFVRQVKSSINQKVTVADNYVWWAREGAQLAREVDFVGVHTYPAWEGRTIEQGMDYTLENIEDVRSALPDVPLVILEAGWPSIASEFGERASEASQARYFNELMQWARQTQTTVFWFEAFDEPWKGNPADPLGAEKHWGIFNVDRSPKQVMLRATH